MNCAFSQKGCVLLWLLNAWILTKVQRCGTSVRDMLWIHGDLLGIVTCAKKVPGQRVSKNDSNNQKDIGWMYHSQTFGSHVFESKE